MRFLAITLLDTLELVTVPSVERPIQLAWRWYARYISISITTLIGRALGRNWTHNQARTSSQYHNCKIPPLERPVPTRLQDNPNIYLDLRELLASRPLPFSTIITTPNRLDRSLVHIQWRTLTPPTTLEHYRVGTTHNSMPGAWDATTGVWKKPPVPKCLVLQPGWINSRYHDTKEGRRQVLVEKWTNEWQESQEQNILQHYLKCRAQSPVPGVSQAYEDLYQGMAATQAALHTYPAIPATAKNYLSKTYAHRKLQGVYGAWEQVWNTSTTEIKEGATAALSNCGSRSRHNTSHQQVTWATGFLIDRSSIYYGIIQLFPCWIGSNFGEILYIYGNFSGTFGKGLYALVLELSGDNVWLDFGGLGRKHIHI